MTKRENDNKNKEAKTQLQPGWKQRKLTNQKGEWGE